MEQISFRLPQSCSDKLRQQTLLLLVLQRLQQLFLPERRIYQSRYPLRPAEAPPQAPMGLRTARLGVIICNSWAASEAVSIRSLSKEDMGTSEREQDSTFSTSRIRLNPSLSDMWHCLAPLRIFKSSEIMLIVRTMMAAFRSSILLV